MDVGFRIWDFGGALTEIRHPKSDIERPLSIFTLKSLETRSFQGFLLL
jgi:hypothetical protein